MSLPYEEDKILTENPFVDLLVYNIKILGYSCVIKDQATADKNETVDSLKESAVYIACVLGTAEVGLFTQIPHSFLVQVGMSTSEIAAYEKDYDASTIPDTYHDALVALLIPWYEKNYSEKNEYYRMITGQPPLGELGIPMRDYEYLIPDDITYTGNYLHEVGYKVCQSLDAAGVLDVIKAEYPNYKYLNYLTQGITIYNARNKLDFQIIWYPETLNYSLTEEFLMRYANNREFMISTVYTSAMEVESDYYHNFMITYVILITMIDLITSVQSHIVKRDVLDRRCIEYIFSMYGIPYYRSIPYKYQERICKNIYNLIKYKSCTKDMLDLIKIFGFEGLEVFKWYILKVRKKNSWGEFEYYSTSNLICEHNDIIEHETISENMSDESICPSIPDDISTMKEYYAGSGLETADTTSTSAAITAANKPSLSTTYPERYIPFPFEYFLQKGNVMFVKLDEYVLRENVDYKIHSYCIIRFLNNIQVNKKKLVYEFYYDNTATASAFAVDKDHAVKTLQQNFTYNGTMTYNLSPLPIDRYFELGNTVSVVLDSIWLSPEMYTINTDDLTLTFEDGIVLDKHSDIVVIYISSKYMKSVFSKKAVEITSDAQSKIYIPEPFKYYCLNGNTFFLTFGTTYIATSRYTIYPSTTEGGSYLTFSDPTFLIKGMKLVFNFLYSTKAPYTYILVDTTVVHVEATRSYQYEFTVAPPIENYVECDYKVFVKILGWWLPAKFFTFVGKNVLTFTDRSLALNIGDSFDVYFVYVPIDRTKSINVKVSTTYAVSTKDKQKIFNISFPTTNYFTKGNKLIVDMEGVPLVEGTDYTVNESTGKITILTFDYRPMKGQRVNYTFYYNQEAEYFLTINTQEIDIEKSSGEDFSIPWPFYPYLETNQDFLVIIGTTMVAKSRIVMTSRFTFRILGIDPTTIGRKITVMFLYNNWFDDSNNAKQKLIVEWKDHYVYEDMIPIETPFEKYIENDWDYFVTYGDRMNLVDSKYDVFNSTFYTYPVEDLMKKVYGDTITFVFVYIKKYPYVKEEESEDYSRTTELYFSKCPIEDIYSSQYLKDSTNWRGYDAITLADGWWDGKYYKKDAHAIIKQSIYEQKFNYARSKYYGVSNVIELGEYSNQLSYFMSALYDDVLLEKNVTLVIPALDASHKFNVAHLFIYMAVLTYIFNGIEDFILDTPTKLLYVMGFNFKADLAALKEYISKRHRDTADFPIWDFIIPTTQVTDFAEFVNNYKTNYAFRKVILKGMVNSEDYREYTLWKKLYDSLLVWKLNFTYFTLDDGTVCTSYTQFLKEKDNMLYQSIKTISAMSEIDAQQDTIINICDSIIYIMKEYLDTDDFKYIFDSYPGSSSANAAKYLNMMIDFFKSYKIVLMPRTETMNIGDDPDDPDNYFRGIDVISSINEQTIQADYVPPLVEKVYNTEHFTLIENGPTETDELPYSQYPVPDYNANNSNSTVTTTGDTFTGIHELGKWMREDVYIDLSNKDSVKVEFPCKINVNKIYSYTDLQSNMIYNKAQSDTDLDCTTDIHYETLIHELDAVVTMSDYIVYNADLITGELYLDGRLFLSGYRMMDIYRPIYQTMKGIPATDITDINTRMKERESNDNIEEMFMDCTKLEVIPEGLNFANSDGRLYFNDIHDLAKDCPNLVSVSFPVVYFPDDSVDKNLKRIFYGCSSLVKIDNLQLTEYTNSTGTVHLEQAFYGCTLLTQGPTYIRSSRELHMEQCFYECNDLTTPSAIETMYGDMYLNYTFYRCKAMTYLPSIYFGTTGPNITSTIYMDHTFGDCFNITNVHDYNNGGYTFVNTTAYLTNTFDSCTSMTKTPAIDVKSKADVYMDNTYSNCTALTTATEIDVSGGASLYLKETYKNDKALTSTYMVSANGSSEVYFENTFEGCSSLVTVYNGLMNINGSGEDNSYHLSDTFKDCTSLTNVTLEASTIKSITNIFTGCTSLTNVTFTNPNSTIAALLTHANLDNNTLTYTITIK